ncbi:MAG: glycosyltransferase family 2 protein [Caldithrix sp.]|nr:glycosyltransferase family 2 protein [candidate division KSB1 bacterium]TDI86453.1 MAG: glycosyltransferase family 2 protein [Caldithrix sp.]
MQNLTVVIPAYNEEHGLTKVLPELIENLENGWEVIVVDDGSTDKTAEIVKGYKKIQLVKHPYNKGYGAALKTGIRAAKNEAILLMDSDGQHSIKDFHRIIKKFGEDDYDLVIGARSTEAYQVKTRVPGKFLLTKTAEYLMGTKIKDLNSGLRIFKKSKVVPFFNILPNSFSFSTTSTLAFLKEAFNVAYIDIETEKREGRKSSVKFARDGSRTLLLITRVIMLFNPLKIFFPVSVLTFALGVLWGLYGVVIFQRIPNSSVILMVFGMFLFFFGMLADQTASIRRQIHVSE